jgi:hypothetical protein
VSDDRRAALVVLAATVELLSTAWIGTLQQVARAKFFGEFKGRSTEFLADAIDTLLYRMVRP